MPTMGHSENPGLTGCVVKTVHSAMRQNPSSGERESWQLLLSERQDQAINSEGDSRAESRGWKEGQERPAGRGPRAVASQEGWRAPSCPGLIAAV